MFIRKLVTHCVYCGEESLHLKMGRNGIEAMVLCLYAGCMSVRSSREKYATLSCEQIIYLLLELFGTYAAFECHICCLKNLYCSTMSHSVTSALVNGVVILS